MGIKNTTHRLLKPLLDNKAIAAMGVKIGRVGAEISTELQKKISETKKTFLFNIHQQSSFQIYRIINYLVRYIFLRAYKS